MRKQIIDTNRKTLSIFFTAGYPEKDSTMHILKELQACGVDMVELGIPFSDPLADGPVIQHSSEVALANNMNLDVLFEQTKNLKQEINIPVFLMGYLNPVMQYGFEKFLQRAHKNGFTGTIIPDLPLREYELEYKTLYEQYNLKNVFLITPQTEEARIKKIDSISDSFIYMVSLSGTTGVRDKFTDLQLAYFKKVQVLQLSNPVLAGFGISNKETFAQACTYANGAIIGSSFIKILQKENYLQQIKPFIKSIKS